MPVACFDAGGTKLTPGERLALGGAAASWRPKADGGIGDENQLRVINEDKSKIMVPRRGLEPPRPKALASKTSVSAISPPGPCSNFKKGQAQRRPAKASKL